MNGACIDTNIYIEKRLLNVDVENRINCDNPHTYQEPLRIN